MRVISKLLGLRDTGSHSDRSGCQPSHFADFHSLLSNPWGRWIRARRGIGPTIENAPFRSNHFSYRLRELVKINRARTSLTMIFAEDAQSWQTLTVAEFLCPPLVQGGLFEEGSAETLGVKRRDIVEPFTQTNELDR